MGQQSNEAKFAALSWMNLDGACEVDSSGYRFRFAARPQLVYQLSYTGILRCSVFTDGRVIIIAHISVTVKNNIFSGGAIAPQGYSIFIFAETIDISVVL